MKVAYVKSDAPKFPRSCFALEIDSATVLLDFSVSLFFALFSPLFALYLSLFLFVFLLLVYISPRLQQQNRNVALCLIYTKLIMLNVNLIISLYIIIP